MPLSDQIRARRRLTHSPRACEYCEKTFRPNRKDQIYCSSACRSNFWHTKQQILKENSLLQEIPANTLSTNTTKKDH